MRVLQKFLEKYPDRLSDRGSPSAVERTQTQC
jgi:hypothetical protein